MRWIFLLFTLPLLALTLDDRLSGGTAGDYIVYQSQQTVTLLHLASLDPKTCIVEEITLPAQQIPQTSWKEWVKNRAPGHSSWSMTEIDRASGEIVECYSFSKGSWITLSRQENLLASLLQLPLKGVPKEARRRIGPPPPDGESDVRPLWYPPLTLEGKKVASTLFQAYQTTWPQDGSELSGKTVIAYFEESLHFPFPCWIQVETTHATGHFRAIDAGHHLRSPFRSLPRKLPQFIGQPIQTKTALTLQIKSPSYFRTFDLFAIDTTTREKEIIPLSFSLEEKEKGLLTLTIDDLSSLIPGHSYTWMLIPLSATDTFIESTTPYLLK